jgi:hypothetical protein
MVYTKLAFGVYEFSVFKGVRNWLNYLAQETRDIANFVMAKSK